MSKMLEREIKGFRVGVYTGVGVHDRPGTVNIEWRDHAHTEELRDQGRDDLLAFHDFRVPVAVLVAAVDMLREKGIVP